MKVWRYPAVIHSEKGVDQYISTMSHVLAQRQTYLTVTTWITLLLQVTNRMWVSNVSKVSVHWDMQFSFFFENRWLMWMLSCGTNHTNWHTVFYRCIITICIQNALGLLTNYVKCLVNNKYVHFLLLLPSIRSTNTVFVVLIDICSLWNARWCDVKR